MVSVEAAEAVLGRRLPEPYRSLSAAQGGGRVLLWPGESVREVLLFDLQRLQDVHGMFQEAYGPAATGIVTIGSVMGGVSTFGVNERGQIIDLFGDPSLWRIAAESLQEFLEKIEAQGVDWLNGLRKK